MNLSAKVGLACAVLAATSCVSVSQELSLSELSERAVAHSKLTTTGSGPFHLKARIAENGNPNSEFKADVEVFWMAPTKWRQVIQSSQFSQTLVVNDGAILENNTGDYYPFWLRQLVTALLDPLPMLQVLEKSQAKVAKPPGPQSRSCARFESRVGVPPVQASEFSVFCFTSDGLPESITTPGYSVEFKDYRKFGDKQVARKLVTYPEPGVTIEATVTELTELKSGDESLFTVSSPTPKERQLRCVAVSEATLRSIGLNTPEIVWPRIRMGKTSGVLTMYVSIDTSGRVRETFPENSDNSDLEDDARKQVQAWQFKPAVVDGEPLQLESILAFAFGTQVGNPVSVLSDSEARKLADNAPEPSFSPGAAPVGTAVTVLAIVGSDGNVKAISNPNNVPGRLFLAASAALKEWHFRPYLKEGKPDDFNAEITFHVK